MKKIILLLAFTFSISSFSQDFDKNWNKVIQFENEGKTKSANTEVQNIYKKAKSSNNEVQIIKCFFYKSKYIQTLEEEAQNKIISNLESEINSVSIPSKAILNLVYAKCLTQYSSNSNNRIYNRTKIDTLTSGSFLTWTYQDFKHKTDELYTKSLENESILKKTSLEKYEPIFDFLNLEQFNKLNLYDYIIDENIQYYSSMINEWGFRSKNYNKFKTNLFSLNNDFQNLSLDFISNEPLKQIVSLYQNKEKNNSSLENKLNRIKFCNKFIIHSDDDYITSIENFQKINSDSLFSQKLLLEKGTIFSKNASKEKYPDYNSKALSCYDSIINFKNHTNQYKIASSLKKKLISKSLSIELQKYIYNNEHTRAFINYKNIDDINISFYKIDFNTLDLIEKNKINKDSLINDLISKNKSFKNISQKLVNKKDYFNYTTEILLPDLETGNYLAYFETESYDGLTKADDSEILTVSNISVLANKSNTVENYTVLDRKTGKPLENVVLKNSYFKTKTDINGKATVEIPKDNKYNYDNITFLTSNDTLKVYKGYINYIENEKEERFNGKVEFYLDRAIYRPGQTMYYKGILTQIKGEKSSIVPNVSLKITIENANNDDIKEFEVTTNEYGSFSGEFILPKNGLTGEFTISADEPKDYTKDAIYDKVKDEHPFWDNVDFDNSELTFKVEEYKRPKFDVAFEPLKGNHQLNEKIEIVGNVKSFAGSSISEAKVNYTISTEIPYNLRDNSTSENELIIGETKTDASGKFTINFDAKPVENSAKEGLPIYYYTIKADVTDTNGETHSSETRVALGYHSMLLKLFVPRIIEKKKRNTLQINSTNLNHDFLGTEGELKFYFIKNFETKFKPRTFQKPEIETISDEDFNALFPYENNENPIPKNEKGTLVYTLKVNTELEKEIFLDFMSNFKSGYYKVIFSATDKFNNLIEKTSDFQFKNKEAYPNKTVSIEQLNEDAKKDNFIKLKITSVLPELHLICSTSYKNNTFSEMNIDLKNHEVIIEIPIQSNYKGSIKIGFETIFENHYFKEEFETFIKEIKPKILFETESFRDKIQPGSIENWSFKLKEDTTIAQAEILASMYDSSLDEFATKNWESLSFRENNYNYTRTNTNLGFQKCSATIKNLNDNNYYHRNDLKNEETKLIWFGFDFNNNRYSNNLKEYKDQITKKARKPIDAKLITGYITDGKMALPGAYLTIKGTNRTCSTDYDGYFEIEASIGEQLVVNFVGFKTVNHIINSKNIFINLIQDSNKLEEVVVMGYKSERKKALTAYSTAVYADKDYDGIYNNAELIQTLQGQVKGVNITSGTGSPGTNANIMIRGSKSLNGNNEPLYVLDGEIINSEEFTKLNPADVLNVNVLKGSSATTLYGSRAANGAIIISTKKALQESSQVQSRRNLNETAFFYPNLKTDKNGKVIINFTSPEALTQWKLRLLAHNKNAVSGYLEKNVITQKDLMIIPNFPRFFREKDTIVITSKIANMTKETKKGMAILQLFDASTMEPIDSKTGNQNNIKNFTINASENTTISWKIKIPEDLQGVQYKVVAKAGNYSDGEENILPVLTNNMLVTESIPIWVRENSKKEYSFENLKNNTSTTLRNHQFTLEYTSNPTWIVIQSLPYLMEYEHECAEQTFARFYANALATEIISSNPKIAKLFEDWKTKDKLTSKLEQNEELKSMILAETPWLKEAESEDEKKNKLALLFNLEKMKNTQDATFEKLKNKQNSSGGFVWFDGGTENEYITRHILAGLGHLKKLNITTASDEKINEVAKKGILFMDTKFLENHKQLIAYQKKYSKFNWVNPYSTLHYLYTRSFYLEDYPISDTLKSTTKKYVDATKENWLNYSLYEKGLAALTLNRFGEKATAKMILESLKETSSNNEDWGMYWIANKSGWYWYQAPIETQALLIEAFSEINNDTKSVDAMKAWLLKNKQTKNWPTTKSTTEAIYALLMQGTDWLSVKDNTIIKIGDEKIMTKKLSENEKEAETGYIKTTWKAEEIKPEMASISIENKSKVPGFGGVYWQYFEDLDKIKTNAGGNLSTSKELYLKKTTNKGEELQKINSTNPLKIGDLVTVRLIIVAKEDMEYVHLKDMRASCFEPTNVLSEYRWKDGLGFYMNTKDAATHFFFDKINKGTYVLEYDIRVNNMGNFSNGITTIESMYAPEFTNHTKGIRVNVKE